MQAKNPVTNPPLWEHQVDLKSELLYVSQGFLSPLNYFQKHVCMNSCTEFKRWDSF